MNGITADRVECEQLRGRGKVQAFLYVIMICAWMFDFRSEGAGQGLAIQGVFMGLYLVSLLFFWFSSITLRPRIRVLLPFIVATFLFIFIGIFSGLVHGQAAYSVFRNSFGAFVYLTVAIATVRMLATCSPRVLRGILGWLCFGFSVSSFLITLLFQGGVDLETVRFQIQGASSIAALGIIPAALCFRLIKIEKIAALSALTVVFLTVTRTYLVVLAFQLFSLGPVIRRVASPRMIVTVAAVLAFASSLIYFQSGVSGRWHQRIFVSEHFDGIDPTLISRQSEWEYMLSTFFAPSERFLIGSGMAAETKYYLSKELGGSGESSSTGFGHSQHISLLFIGGVVGGLPLLVFQFLLAWRALKVISQTVSARVNPDLGFLAVWGAMIVIGTLASDFFSSSLASRGFSLWYGIGTGLLLGTKATMR